MCTIIVAMSATTLLAQSDSESTPRYKLLATKRTSTMQKEVDEVASQGYRILSGSPTAGTEMALFLGREATPEKPYAYKLLATKRTSTMNKELNELADEGFRLIPSTMISKVMPVWGDVEIVMLMERPPKIVKLYEYKLLATTRTSTLQKEVSEAEAAGYKLVGMVSRGEHMVIMEREIDYVAK